MASKKILIQVDVTTKSAEVQINKVVDSMNKLEGATAKFADTTKKSRAQSGLNNAILIESGRFASDLRFGFTAVANNLGRIIELGQEFSRTEGGGLGPALRRIISVQGLFLIGFQLLVAYGDKVFAFLRGLVTEINVANDAFKNVSDNIGETSTNFEIYISKLQDSNTSQEEQNIIIKKLNEEFPDFVQNLKDSGISMENVKNQTEAANIAIENQRKQIIALGKSRAALNKIQEIQSDIIDDQIKGEKIANELGFETFEEALERERELYSISRNLRTREEKDEIARFSTVQLLNLSYLENIDERIKKKELEIDKLEQFVNFEIELEKKKTKTQEEEINIKEVDFTKGNIRMQNLANRFGAKAIENQFDRNQAELEAQRDFYFNQIDQTLALETEKERARFEVNKYFSEQIIKNNEAEAEARKSIQLGIVSTYARALGSLSQLLGKNTAAGKVAALGEIAAGTAVGFIQALDIAQKAAKGTGPLASLAFPVFYASQVAAVLGAAAQAKQVLESGGRTSASRPTAGTSAPSITTEAPDFNVVGIGGVTQLGQVIGQQFGQPIRAYVVSDDVRSGLALDRNITGNAKLD